MLESPATCRYENPLIRCNARETRRSGSVKNPKLPDDGNKFSPKSTPATWSETPSRETVRAGLIERRAIHGTRPNVVQLVRKREFRASIERYTEYVWNVVATLDI